MLPPAKFLTLAQQTRTHRADRHLGAQDRLRATHGLARRRDCPLIQISVNLTPQQLEDEHLVPAVLAALAESGMPAQMLELEFSEMHVVAERDPHVAYSE